MELKAKSQSQRYSCQSEKRLTALGRSELVFEVQRCINS